MQPWEERRKAESQEEQRFIDAWAESRTRQLQDLFPVTSKTITDKDGNRTHESINPQTTCKHPTVRAIRWIAKMSERQVARKIPVTKWNEENKVWEATGEFQIQQTIEEFHDGQEREWTCTTCDMHIPESALQRMYPEIKFDKPEVHLV